ncbi:MAG TPA: hypothetical protein VMI75_18400 [Polyangiaceae bacterium]|nr:hypothetical protein [Polyangiaceae bacterium]
MRAALLLLGGLLVLGCGGSTSHSPDASAPEDASKSDAPADAGGDGCSPGMAVPTYDCDAEAPDATGCPAWGSNGGPPFYPPGCQVTVPPMQTTFGCAPLMCPCTSIPTSDGGSNFAFTCPL